MFVDGGEARLWGVLGLVLGMDGGRRLCDPGSSAPTGGTDDSGSCSSGPEETSAVAAAGHLGRLVLR